MPQAGLLSSLSPVQALHGLGQPLRDLLHSQRARRTPDGRLYEGSGQPVIVFPLEGTGPESTAALRRLLGDLGFRPYDWGLGRDEGTRGMGLNRWLRRLEECVIDAFELAQSPVTLLGWGLSGIYVRELAKRTNPLVRQVITLGTPFNTAADPIRSCRLLAMLEQGPDRLPLAVRTRLRQCPPVPWTSIFSRDDGVVRPEQCVGPESPEGENIEVDGATHDQLASHPVVLEVVTHRLAQPEGSWKPFPPARLRRSATADS